MLADIKPNQKKGRNKFNRSQLRVIVIFQVIFKVNFQDLLQSALHTQFCCFLDLGYFDLQNLGVQWRPCFSRESREEVAFFCLKGHRGVEVTKSRCQYIYLSKETSHKFLRCSVETHKTVSSDKPEPFFEQRAKLPKFCERFLKRSLIDFLTLTTKR